MWLKKCYSTLELVLIPSTTVTKMVTKATLKSKMGELAEL